MTGEVSEQARSRITLQETLSALKSVIEAEQDEGHRHEPTATEYFALLSKTITVGAGGDSLPNFLRILNAVIPKSSRPIVQSQFKPVAGALLKILEANAESTSVTAVALDALGTLLLMQEYSEGFWGLMPPLQSLNALLSFVDSEQVSLMKISHNHLVSLLTDHFLHKAQAVRGYLADFSIGVMRACTRSSYKRAHCVVLLLERSLCLLPEKQLPQVLDSMLQLQQCEVPKLTAAVFRALDALFQNPRYSLTAESTSRIATKLLRSPPRTYDMEANTFYCTALGSIVQQVGSRQAEQLPALVCQVLQTFIVLCDSDFVEVHCAIGSTLKRMFQYFFDRKVVGKVMPTLLSPGVASAGGAVSAAVDPQLVKILNEFMPLLQLRYMPAWLYTLDAARSLFSTFKMHNLPVTALKQLVLKLADLNQAVENGAIPNLDPQLHLALSESLGVALRAVGVLNFLAMVPLKDNNDEAHAAANNKNDVQQPIPASREWIITLLHAQLKQMPCDIADFGKAILPLANEYYHSVKTLQTGKQSDGLVRIMRTRITQLWSLLPEFCYLRVGDVPQSFPKLADILEKIFGDGDYPELVPIVVRTLHNLTKSVNAQHPQYQQMRRSGSVDDSNLPPAISTLQVSTYKFLPLLLQYCEGMPLDDSRFKDAAECISVLVTIAPVSLVEAVSKKLMQLVLTSTTANSDDNDAAASWMAVMLAMIPQLPHHLVVLLFKAVQPLLVAVETSSVQKRSYSLLVSLLEHHRSVVLQQAAAIEIMKAISASLFTCHISARSMRLRAMGVLMNDMEALDLKQVVDMVFQELLTCLKDPNKKSRDAAMDLLVFFIEYLTPEDLWSPLTAALSQGMGDGVEAMDVDTESMMSSKRSSITHVRSAAVTGLCLLIVNNRHHAELLNEAVQLLPKICAFGTMECPHLTRSMLGYLRVFVSTQPLSALRESLPVVVTAFTGQGLGAAKSKFSSRCRAIMRKLCSRLGESSLREHVPASDMPLLDYVCRQARKAQRKKAASAVADSSLRGKVEHMLGSDSEDDDSDAGVDMDDDGDDGDFQAAAHSSSQERSALLESIQTAAAAHNQRVATADYRLAARPKATRAADVQLHQQKTLPSSLEDLLEDQPPVLSVQRGTSKTNKRLNVDALNGRGRGVSRDIDDDENQFNVVVTKDGKVVVKELEHDTASLNTSKPQEAPNVGDEATDEAAAMGSANELQQHGRFRSDDQGQSKKRKLNLRDPGAEYRSKKAGGDVWKKGMLEPYAYIPLDPRLLSKRHKAEAVQHFGTVVKNKRNNGNNDGKRGRAGAGVSRKKR